MKRTLTSLFIVTLFTVVCLLTSIPALAQSDGSSGLQIIKEANSPESTTCPPAQTFTFGSGASKFAFCITDHGNIRSLESPATFNHLTHTEGYVVCGTGIADAYDAAANESGWSNPSATDQPNGPHTFPLAITRNSTDGKLQLKQSFDWDTEKKEITVTMVLKNISGAAIKNVKLARYIDGDMDGTPSGDLYNAGTDSVWGRQSGSSGVRHGVMLTALSFATAHTPEVETYLNWSNNRGSCTPVAEAVPTAPGDYVARMTFSLGTISAGQSKTVKMLYKRF